ncbi:hypothetical protein STEG23_033549 [Scotinomys teguina]
MARIYYSIYANALLVSSNEMESNRFIVDGEWTRKEQNMDLRAPSSKFATNNVNDCSKDIKYMLNTYSVWHTCTIAVTLKSRILQPLWTTVEYYWNRIYFQRSYTHNGEEEESEDGHKGKEEKSEDGHKGEEEESEDGHKGEEEESEDGHKG